VGNGSKGSKRKSEKRGKHCQVYWGGKKEWKEETRVDVLIATN
jgi:hypothetical protein